MAECMQTFNLQKGADLPITGAPEQAIVAGPAPRSVALLGPDYLDLKPRVQVEVGQSVRRGETIFFHKDLPQVAMTAPLSGTITAINRGARRALLSIEIEVTDADDQGIDFSGVGSADDAAGLIEKLCASGLWTSFRTRPYSKLADPASRPTAIVVTATGRARCALLRLRVYFKHLEMSLKHHLFSKVVGGGCIPVPVPVGSQMRTPSPQGPCWRQMRQQQPLGFAEVS